MSYNTTGYVLSQGFTNIRATTTYNIILGVDDDPCYWAEVMSRLLSTGTAPYRVRE